MGPWKINETDFPKDGSIREKLMFLLRYAVLAPSSHNTQPWKFSIKENEIMVFVNPSRWLRIADPDKRELYISVGCAMENLLIASKYFGFTPEISYFPRGQDVYLVASVKLTSPGPQLSEEDVTLFNMIPLRHSNKKIYENRLIAKKSLKRLFASYAEKEIKLYIPTSRPPEIQAELNDITVYITSDPEIKAKVDDIIVRADIMQYTNPDFRKELGHWIGEGVFGTPWLISQIGKIVVKYTDQGKKIGRKDEKALLSASHLAVICSKENTRLAQVKVGQVFERLALTATAMEIRVHPMNQPMEIPKLKEEIKALVQTIVPEMDETPQHTFRLGYAEPSKHIPRRSLEEVLIQ
jgi:hypothetical protein